MKHAALQRKGKALYPFSVEDENVILEYPENQIINAKFRGVTIPRSYEQLKLYFACCRKVAENIDTSIKGNEGWGTKDDVDFNCRIACKLIKRMKIVDGVFYAEPSSIGYDNLSHLQACKYFDRAFDIMAKKLGITTKELTDEAKLGE